jgi:hypothetical protein
MAVLNAQSLSGDSLNFSVLSSIERRALFQAAVLDRLSVPRLFEAHNKLLSEARA